MTGALAPQACHLGGEPGTVAKWIHTTTLDRGTPVVPTFIMALLIVAAIGLLASSVLGGRRDRDPSSSVHHFNRAMSAMSNATPPAPGPRTVRDDESDDLAART